MDLSKIKKNYIYIYIYIYIYTTKYVIGEHEVFVKCKGSGKKTRVQSFVKDGQ